MSQLPFSWRNLKKSLFVYVQAMGEKNGHTAAGYRYENDGGLDCSTMFYTMKSTSPKGELKKLSWTTAVKI
jgi:hypothetical protein